MDGWISWYITHQMYENGNGFNSRMTDNDKVDKAKKLTDDMKPDIVAFNEHKLNLRRKDKKRLQSDVQWRGV